MDAADVLHITDRQSGSREYQLSLPPPVRCECVQYSFRCTDRCCTISTPVLVSVIAVHVQYIMGVRVVIRSKCLKLTTNLSHSPLSSRSADLRICEVTRNATIDWSPLVDTNTTFQKRMLTYVKANSNKPRLKQRRKTAMTPIIPYLVLSFLIITTVLGISNANAKSISNLRSIRCLQKKPEKEDVKQLGLFWNEVVAEAPPIKTPMGELADVFGDGVLVPIKNKNGLDDIDMSQLLKACRKFEEVMRSVGEIRSAKDLSSNIKKVTDVYKSAPAHKRKTMSSLLRYERELGVHPDMSDKIEDNPYYHGRPRRRLKDPSAAMGLLWIRRSIAFNYHMYSNICCGEIIITPKVAALDAYNAVLEPCHGWALRRLYTLGIQSITPPRHELIATLAGHADFPLAKGEEEATVRDLKRLVATWRPLIARWKQTFEELDLDDRRRA
jgi:hypothetical protein